MPNGRWSGTTWVRAVSLGCAGACFEGCSVCVARDLVPAPRPTPARERSGVHLDPARRLHCPRTRRDHADIPPECGTRAAFDAELSERLGDDAPTEHRARLDHASLRVASTCACRSATSCASSTTTSCTELFRAAVVVAVAMLLHEPRQARRSAAAAARPAVAAARVPALQRRCRRRSQRRHVAAPSAGARARGQSLLAIPGGERERALPFAHRQARRQRARASSCKRWAPASRGSFRPSRRWEARLGFAAQRLSGRGDGSIAKAQRRHAFGRLVPRLGLGFVPIRAAACSGPGWGPKGQLNAAAWAISRFSIILRTLRSRPAKFTRCRGSPAQLSYAWVWSGRRISGPPG